MSTTLVAPTTTPIESTTHGRPQPVWRVGLLAGVAASVATTLVAAIADAAGVSLDVAGETIPLIGFTNLTMIGAIIGIALAAVLGRRARHPRSTFVRTAVALTLLSLVPDVVADADAATRFVLALTHVVAAAIVVPAIARRVAA